MKIIFVIDIFLIFRIKIYKRVVNNYWIKSEFYKSKTIMIIGDIGYLSKEKDEAFITILSRQNFLEKLYFKPSLVGFGIHLGKIICISQMHEKNDFLKFNIKDHEQFLNIDEIKLRSGGISIPNNLDLMDYLIDNELDNNQNPKLIELKLLKKKIKFNNGFPSQQIMYSKPTEIIEIIDQYKIYYQEGGYNKPGDYSKGWISVTSTTSNKKLDLYLQKLLPNFNFLLGKSDDCEEYRFKDSIIGMIKNEIGTDNIEEIENLCLDLTTSIQRFAKLVYREEEHANALWHYCHKLRQEIKNEYKLNSIN